MLEELQLLCLLQETPRRYGPRFEDRTTTRPVRLKPPVNGSIPRGAWERVRTLCPRLAVSVVLSECDASDSHLVVAQVTSAMSCAWVPGENRTLWHGGVEYRLRRYPSPAPSDAR